MARAGRWGRAAVAAALAALLFDVQRDWPALIAAGRVVAEVFAAAFCVGALLDRGLLTALAPAALLLLVLTLVRPIGATGAPPWTAPIAGPSDLPVVLHVVVDEHIGVEGIPVWSDPDDALRDAIQRFYRERGFRLFGNVFARYEWSVMTLSRLVNFDASGEENHIEPPRLQANAYFEQMAARGYRIHVYDTSLIDFCGSPGVEVGACTKFPTTTIRALAGAELEPGDAARLILGMYGRRSGLLAALRSGYARLHARDPWRAALPEWRPPPLVSPLAAMALAERLERDLLGARRGSFYFAHLLLPHHPYAYDRQCRLRTPDAWRMPEQRALSWRNTRASRRERYPLYLEQVLCTQRVLDRLLESLERAGVGDDAIVLVHGDHGSRLAKRAGGRLSATDLIDLFSTHFAIRGPEVAPGYDRRLLPLGELFARAIADPAGLDAPFEIRSLRVQPGMWRAGTRRMPDFRRGRLHRGRRTPRSGEATASRESIH